MKLLFASFRRGLFGFCFFLFCSNFLKADQDGIVALAEALLAQDYEAARSIVSRDNFNIEEREFRIIGTDHSPTYSSSTLLAWFIDRFHRYRYFCLDAKIDQREDFEQATDQAFGAIKFLLKKGADLSKIKPELLYDFIANPGLADSFAEIYNKRTQETLCFIDLLMAHGAPAPALSFYGLCGINSTDGLIELLVRGLTIQPGTDDIHQVHRYKHYLQGHWFLPIARCWGSRRFDEMIIKLLVSLQVGLVAFQLKESRILAEICFARLIQDIKRVVEQIPYGDDASLFGRKPGLLGLLKNRLKVLIENSAITLTVEQVEDLIFIANNCEKRMSFTALAGLVVKQMVLSSPSASGEKCASLNQPSSQPQVALEVLSVDVKLE